MAITTDRDRVRLLIGDTDETDPQLYDDEVDAILDQRSVIESTGGTVYNVVAAAADCAGAISAKYARQFTFNADGQSFQLAQRVQHYQTLEVELRRRAGGVSVPLTIGGTETT